MGLDLCAALKRLYVHDDIYDEVVADIPNDNPLVQEEQFGPALPVIRYSKLEDDIAMANGVETPRFSY